MVSARLRPAPRSLDCKETPLHSSENLEIAAIAQVSPSNRTGERLRSLLRELPRDQLAKLLPLHVKTKGRGTGIQSQFSAC